MRVTDLMADTVTDDEGNEYELVSDEYRPVPNDGPDRDDDGERTETGRCLVCDRRVPLYGSHECIEGRRQRHPNGEGIEVSER
jgi:hypothetical protein